jgi:transposase
MAGSLVPDDLWAAISPLLPPDPPRPKGGRPRVPNRAALTGIIFVLRTGIQWRDVPAGMGCSGKTCWRRLIGWHEAGVWVALHRTLLERLRGADRLDWRRASLDSASVRAKGGRGDRAQPDGQRQSGHQATPGRRRRGHPARRGHQPGQPARQPDARAHAGRRPVRSRAAG